MQFLIIVIHIALMGLTVWWAWRVWHKSELLSESLGNAAGKATVALVAAYLVPVLLLSSFGPLSQSSSDVLIRGLLVFVGVAFVLYVAAGVTKTSEGIRGRAALRLSGHPVPPKLWPAWGVATATGVIMFFLMVVTNIVFVYLATYIAVLQNQPTSSNSIFQTITQNFIIGTAIAWIVSVALMWAFQKASIFTAERDYAQLKTGIEQRLAQQREELLSVRLTDSAAEQK